MTHPIEARTRPSDLVHPLPLTAVALLLLNDHLFKGSGLLPGWLTGKISDFAGLYFFPVLLTVLAERACRSRSAAPSRRRIAWASVVFTGALFTALKSLPALAALASRLVGSVVCDPSDLLALASLAFSLRYLLRDQPALQPPPRWAQALTVLGAATASLATTQVHEVRGYPAWVVAGPASRAVGCARAEAWVSKSGKQGLGVTLRFTAPEATACAVQITGARLSLVGSTTDTLAPLPASVAAPPPSPAVPATAHVYLPFAFDNEAAWNERNNAAVLRIEIVPAGGAAEAWEIPLEQRYEGPHVDSLPAIPGAPR